MISIRPSSGFRNVSNVRKGRAEVAKTCVHRRERRLIDGANGVGVLKNSFSPSFKVARQPTDASQCPETQREGRTTMGYLLEEESDDGTKVVLGEPIFDLVVAKVI